MHTIRTNKIPNQYNQTDKPDWSTWNAAVSVHILQAQMIDNEYSRCRTRRYSADSQGTASDLNTRLSPRNNYRFIGHIPRWTAADAMRLQAID